MPKKALVDYNFIKELSEKVDFSKKDKRFFRAKVKNSLNGGSKRAKKIEEIRHLLMAATKTHKKSGKKKDAGRPAKRAKLEKRPKPFTQYDSESGSESGSNSGSSEGSESESATDNPKVPSEASSGSSGSDSEDKEKNK